MRRTTSALAALAVLSVSGIAAAHIEIQTPPSINTGAQIKNPVCGCVFGGAGGQACATDYMVTQVMEGEQIEITWKETILHPGNFRIAFSDKTPETVTEADFEVDVDEFVDDNETQNADISRMVTVPPGTRVIQVRQEMTDDPADPFYYGCIAVEVMSAGTTSATSATTSAATNATVAATVAPAAVVASTGTGDPSYEPEPSDDGCAVNSSSTEGSGYAFGIAVLGAAAFLTFRKRR